MNNPENTWRKILVADDESEIRYCLKTALQMSQFQVTTAKNGQEVVQKFMKAHRALQPFDMLITDIVMPGMNGETLIKCIRKFSRQLPILAISAFNDKNSRMRLLQLGCDGFLQKPFDYPTILHVIKKLMAGIPLHRFAVQ